jgi:16S rRNA (cytosine967-C5)-methyltransferase
VFESGCTADDALTAYETAPQRRAIRAVALGTLRWYSRCEALIAPLLARPIEQTAPALRALLTVAVHQLEHSRNPHESTVSASVDAARLLGHAHAAALVNAVLRRFLRERAERITDVERDPAICHAHPQWLVAALQAAWPDCWEALLAANNEHPPLCLRLDGTRVMRDDYLRELAEAGIEARAVPWLPLAVTLDKPLPVERIPRFREGQVSVQDASAQLAARLLAPRSGERVLDACAAPGGKSGALLELAPDVQLTAVDADAERLQRVADNLRRLGRNAGLVVADLLAPPRWWDGTPFDAILLDAPCSATGVIRRHPEIRWLRRAADIAPLAARQRQLLDACWPMLKPGGRLVYVTCSLLPAENTEVVADFLARHADARELECDFGAAPLRRCAPGWQALPLGEAAGDGFYYACLQRVSDQATG